MNIAAFFASLGAALLARLSSVGAAVAAGFTTIVMSFTTDQRQIILDIKQKFADSYAARMAAGDSEINAIEGAATDAYNVFCNEEGKEFKTEAGAVITLLESAAKSAAGILASTLTTSVIPAAVQAAQSAVAAGEAAVEKNLPAS